MKRTPKNLINHRSGLLTVVALGDLDYLGRRTWQCRCACGRTAVVVDKAVRYRRTRSCGCLVGGRDVIITPSLAARFWEIVGEDRDTRECWVWPKGCGSTGYGVLNWKGRALGAHRVALAIKNGGFLDGRAECCHTCDNPRCISPAHLQSGSHRDNHQQAVERGRYAHLATARKSKRAV